MDLLALFFAANGRIAPRSFALGVTVVYAIAFLSQMLLSRPALAHIGWLPFALLQTAASWCWFCLHAKRLHDADRRLAPAITIAVLYGLAMVLLVLVVVLVSTGVLGDPTKPPGIALADFLLPVFLTVLLGDGSDLGLFARIAAAFLALVLAPIAIAIGFSIWTGSRPSVLGVPAVPA